MPNYWGYIEFDKVPKKMYDKYLELNKKAYDDEALDMLNLGKNTWRSRAATAIAKLYEREKPFSMSQLSKMFGCSTSTISQILSEQKIETRKIGTDYDDLQQKKAKVN